jgi:hypothetical protein
MGTSRREGLATALAAQARNVTVAVTIEADGWRWGVCARTATSSPWRSTTTAAGLTSARPLVVATFSCHEQLGGGKGPQTTLGEPVFSLRIAQVACVAGGARQEQPIGRVVLNRL